MSVYSKIQLKYTDHFERCVNFLNFKRDGEYLPAALKGLNI
jgi:hypothetical protein